MDTEILARVQFALTIMFHYIYPPLSIGLGIVLVVIESIWLKTKNPLWLNMAKFWTKIFALTFAFGVATGIVMEFEFGTNWAAYSRFVGDVFGSALAAEGIFAFFLESGFLAILLFGWDRVKPKMHFFSTLMVCLGAHFSAIWIIVANSWMQTPAGFHIVGEGTQMRAEITDFWAMVFNPSSMMRLYHAVIGAWLAGAFLVISLSAYYFMKKKHLEFAKNSLKVGLSIASIALILQLITGDQSGKIVAKYQPSKLAALEGIFTTQQNAPLALFGVVNTQEKRIDYALEIPGLLSYLSFGDFSAEIKGLDQVPEKDWPRTAFVFQTYRLMLLSWGLMFLTVVVAILLWRRDALFHHKWGLRLLLISAIYPQIGNQAGWVSAEMGRYPWIVYNLMRISDGVTKTVPAEHILGSLILFTLLYMALFVVFVFLLNDKFKHGPEEIDYTTTYPRQKEVANER